MHALSQIRQIDYTIIFARDMDAMRHFYETIMEFPLLRKLSDRWIEYRLGSTTLALTTHGGRFNDAPPAQGTLSLQLAFRVPTAGGSRLCGGARSQRRQTRFPADGSTIRPSHDFLPRSGRKCA